MTLADLLVDWLPRQRWFASKSSRIDGVRPHLVSLLHTDDERRLEIWVVEVEAAGQTAAYQLPLVTSRADRLPPSARIGTLPTGQLSDGAADPDLTALLLELMHGTAKADGLVAGSTEGLPDLHGPGLSLGAEQSNTSLVFGDRAEPGAVVLKLFRRLTPSPNPDLEVSRRLGELGSAHVPAAIGWIEGAGYTLGIAQPFLSGAVEGWSLALSPAGADFAAEAERLGAMTAGLHADLRAAFGTRDRPAAELAAVAAGMRDRLDSAVRAVTALEPYAEAISAAYDDVAHLDGPLRVQRVHGDYHLGQVLRTDDAWVALDFEGEPARPLRERVSPSSPLRDVAGMLRSLDYAAAQRGDLEWSLPNRDAFCAGYAAASGRDPRAELTLLRAYELDKAVYEVRYEADHRPEWIAIPLHGIARLVGGVRAASEQ